MNSIFSINLFAVASIFVFISTFSIGIFVLLKRKNERLNQVWAIFCFFLSIWGIGSYNVSTVTSKEEAFFWWKIANIGAIFIPIGYYQFIYTFLSLKKYHHKSILVVSYFLGCIFLIFNFFFPEYFIGDLTFNQIFKTNFSYKNPLYLIFYITFYWILLLYAFSLLIISYKNSKGPFRSQLNYVILASIIGWMGGHAVFLSVIKIDIQPYGNFLITISPFITAYAILRYRLMDVNIVFKKTMVYSLSAGLLMSFFVVVTLTITKFLSTYTHVDSFKVSIFVAFIIALLFNPFRNKIQTLIDKLFYKKSYDYYATIGKISHDLTPMFDLKKIYSFIGDTIFSALGLRSIYLLSAGPGGDYEVVYHVLHDEKEKRDKKTSKIEGNCFMVKSLKTSENIVIKDELPALVALLGQEAIDCVTANLELFDGEAVMPVVGDGKPSLLMILGGKLSGDIFTNEDVNFLKTVSNQTAIAIKNAKLYSDKLRSERFASIGMMSATFAHEIRNPLTSIKTFTQLFPEKFADAEFRNTFSKIVIDDIGRIDGLIKDLLSFSSKESVPGINTLDVTELVDNVIESQKNKFEFEKNNINIRKKYNDARINMLGDTKKLKQALINIITNGCQAMQGNGVLTVDIIPNSKEVDIKISDTGKGMSSQEMAKIFDPFYTTKALGMGLGLAISKKIIEDQGGRIAVESKLSQGTTFTISLPVEKKVDN